ncbi:PREDICTED: uncharacterized protein LOC106119726 [Papilio xuthus]|uniref:Uncharacterized protein LOC106119726 n=1 Tax=Papilio xuthus TaxID=66420 RepID=A0AAJ7EBB0_PAPXU|nr:PREDICTED: uncharacterized protein LOC106119726 [Papilio xuthus]
MKELLRITDCMSLQHLCYKRQGVDSSTTTWEPVFMNAARYIGSADDDIVDIVSTFCAPGKFNNNTTDALVSTSSTTPAQPAPPAPSRGALRAQARSERRAAKLCFSMYDISLLYGHVLSKFDAHLADEVEDILSNPTKDKYQHLKAELIKRFSTSKKQRTRQLLSEEQRGDRKPTAFLRHLRNLAGPKGDEDIIRELWIRHLPGEIQRILIAQEDLPLEKLAEIADNIMDTLPHTPAAINETRTLSPQNLETLMHRIDELSRKVDALSRNNTRITRSASCSKSRSMSSSRSGTRLCWYHKKFAGKARKCVSPCSWSSDNKENFRSSQ